MSSPLHSLLQSEVPKMSLRTWVIRTCLPTSSKTGERLFIRCHKVATRGSEAVFYFQKPPAVPFSKNKYLPGLGVTVQHCL